MKAKFPIGELLIKKNLVSEEEMAEVLRIQVSSNRRVGYLLIKMGFIDSDQLISTLAEQLEIPVIAIDEQFSPEVKKLIPRYLCHKYSILPLAKKPHNVLSLAMVDPLDREAISSIENFTGMVVEPNLARHSDVTTSISRKIPFSAQDIFNEQSYGLAAKVATACVLILFVILSAFAARYVYVEKYGTVQTVADSTVYKNHDIMVDVKKSGKVSLLGRGARASGFYSVTFNDLDSLQAFLQKKETDFSEKQYQWLTWTLENRINQIDLQKNIQRAAVTQPPHG
ncbi:MAG: hypothetical protein KKD73_06290 [Proteobacteria bacterium]|nr:hypothetical protein [Pseudomonadota bacterium]MBU1640684.1 hypothetical protein [Pseudomonadota bacterium]